MRVEAGGAGADGEEAEGAEEVEAAAARAPAGGAWRGRFALSLSSCWLRGTCAACGQDTFALPGSAVLSNALCWFLYISECIILRHATGVNVLSLHWTP